MKYNFGIIGCGNIATKFADTLNKMNLSLLGVASRNLDKALDFANKYNAKKAYGSYEEMLQNDDIDIIYIATPHGLHYEHLKLCLKYKKHIICEKAFTLNSLEAKEVLSIAKENNCLVMEAMWTRFLPSIRKLKELIDSKKYGKIKTIEAEFCFYGNQDENFRLQNNKLGGGALLDVGVYPITLAHLLLGKPISIESKGTLSKTNVDLNNEILFKYEDAIAKLHSSFVYQGNRYSKIILEKATIILDAFWKCELIEIREQDNNIINLEYPFDINGFEYQIQSFINTLNSNKLENEIMPHSTTIEVLEILDEIRKQIGVIYENEKR